MAKLMSMTKMTKLEAQRETVTATGTTKETMIHNITPMTITTCCENFAAVAQTRPAHEIFEAKVPEATLDRAVELLESEDEPTAEEIAEAEAWQHECERDRLNTIRDYQIAMDEMDNWTRHAHQVHLLKERGKTVAEIAEVLGEPSEMIELTLARGMQWVDQLYAYAHENDGAYYPPNFPQLKWLVDENNEVTGWSLDIEAGKAILNKLVPVCEQCGQVKNYGRIQWCKCPSQQPSH